jgi:AAA domain-containing protein
MASSIVSSRFPSPITCAQVAGLVPNLATSTVSEPTLEPEDGPGKVQLVGNVLGDNLSATAVVDAVAHEISLNEKQFLVAERIIQGPLASKDHSYDGVKREQLLICIATEGGSGRYQLIKAIVMAMKLLNREHEMMLLAPTGAAAHNIGGNTIHNALGMSNASERKRTQSLWNRKTVMVVDEVGMIDIQTLAQLSNRCKVVRSLSPESPELFGGLPIVVLLGDFKQFPPVKSLPLWRQARDREVEEFLCEEIRKRFNEVILLDH